MNLNRAMIIGNLTRDPELRTTAAGQSVCTLGVATNRVWTDAKGQKQEEVEFHSVVAWGKLAEICSQYLAKGRKVYLEGRLKTREWQGQDGAKKQRTEIIAENMIMLDRGQGVSAPSSASGVNLGAMAATNTAEAAPGAALAADQEIRVEDIPF